MTVNIVEILGRSSQGITRPFLCRGDDGHLNYVKGRGAGYRALVCEWLAGSLGKRLGLPIPEFNQATIPKELVAMSAREDIEELGSGTAFASQMVENADELTYLFIEQIDPTLRAKTLLFDWWTANGDRTLTEHGGNPNLLWVHRDQKPYIIDHNLAFDETALADFWSQHIFAASRALWTPEFRRDMEQVMRAELVVLPGLWQAMPPEWTEVNIGLTLESVATLLWRFDRDPGNFWGAP